MSTNNQTNAATCSEETLFRVGQTVRFVSKRGYHVRPDGDVAEVYAHFPAASNGGTEYWGINITDEQSPDGRSHVATADELHEHSTTERTAPAGPRDGLPNDAGSTAGSESPASPRAAGTGPKPTEQVFREALARIGAGFYTEKGAEQHAKDIIWLVDSQDGAMRPTAQPGRCKSMHAIQCTEVVDHDGDHCHETVTWPNRCDVCHGSGEIIFNKHGGDPAFDESRPCPECAESQS